MLNTYLNQTSELCKALRDGEDNHVMSDRGEVQYLSPVIIKCRKQVHTKEVLTTDAQVVKTECIYYLTVPVAEGDLLDGRRVQTVVEWRTLGGAVMGYKAVA